MSPDPPKSLRSVTFAHHNKPPMLIPGDASYITSAQPALPAIKLALHGLKTRAT